MRDADRFRRVKPITSYTCKLTDSQADVLRGLLEDEGYEFRAVPHARFAALKPGINVVFYQSGKLVVQGKGTEEFVQFVLEPRVLQEARLGYEAVHDPELFVPRLGIDESGKGDFFGPLCIAGVYVNEQVVCSLLESGIKDSKKISSDRRIRELGKRIRETGGLLWNVVTIGNEAYNRLYAKSGSVNRLLAWGHGRVIENLMQQRGRMIPAPVKAISDQFAADKETIARALQPLGRTIELVQRHKAESDVAVAAASILAREEFINRLAALEKAVGSPLPRGASALVDAAAKELAKRDGVEALAPVAKMHFRTALRAQGLPEPPKIEWRSRKS
jgi:ribonuclease HIII